MAPRHPVEAPPPRLGTIAAGAELMGTCNKTVRRYISAGRLTGYRLGPRMMRVDLDEVAALARAIPTAGKVPRPREGR